MKPNSFTIALYLPFLIGGLVPESGRCQIAAAFTNGSFELPGGLLPGEFLALTDGDTRLTGWTVGGGDGAHIGLINGQFAPGGIDFSPADGAYQLSFNGGDASPGMWISQSFETTIGEDYALTFRVGRNGSAAADVSMTASVTSETDDLLGQITALPPVHGYGKVQRLFFTANSMTTTLEFLDTSTDTVSADIELDSVTLALRKPELSIQVSQVLLSWDSVSNRLYQVQFRSDLTTNLWSDFGSPVRGDGGVEVVNDETLSHPGAFYRVIRLPDR